MYGLYNPKRGIFRNLVGHMKEVRVEKEIIIKQWNGVMAQKKYHEANLYEDLVC